MTKMHYPPTPPPPPPPPTKKTFTERNHIILVRPKLQYACSAWDLHDQKDKTALERVHAMCMVFNYSVDSTDFRHKNSILLLLEKHRSN